MTANSLNLQFPKLARAPSALMLNRALLKDTFPLMDSLLHTLIDSSENYEKSLSILAGRVPVKRYVQTFLKSHWDSQKIQRVMVSDDSFFFFLPDEFESSLEQLVISSPAVINQLDIDSGIEKKYFRWHCNLPGEIRATEICVHLEEMLSQLKVSETRYFKNGWVPMVMISGNTIAVGGFVVDECLIESVRLAEKPLESCAEDSSFLRIENAVGERKLADVPNPTSHKATEQVNGKPFWNVAIEHWCWYVLIDGL